MREITSYTDETTERSESCEVLVTNLIRISEKLEIALDKKKIKNKYILSNGEDFQVRDCIFCSLIRIIWRYCEPLDTESTAKLYVDLEKIEEWLIERI